MLRQIEWRLQNGSIIKSGVLPVTTLLENLIHLESLIFLGKFVPVLEPLKKS